MSINELAHQRLHQHDIFKVTRHTFISRMQTQDTFCEAGYYLGKRSSYTRTWARFISKSGVQWLLLPGIEKNHL